MDLTIPLQLESKTPIYIQIYDYMKQEILKGTLPAGTRLPSHRNLALQLGVSRITVESAYQQLSAEGYVDSKPKRGIFVTEVDVDVIPYKQHAPFYQFEKNKQNRSFLIVIKETSIKQPFHSQIGKEPYKNVYSNMKTNYLQKKIHKENIYFVLTLQNICIMLAGFIAHLTKLLLVLVHNPFFGYLFNYLGSKNHTQSKILGFTA